MGERQPKTGVECAWTVPKLLAAEVADGAAVEVLYVHVPFARDFDQPAHRGTYTELMRLVDETMVGFLEGLGCAWGLQRWPADDLVAWLADSPSRPLRPLLNPDDIMLAAQLFLKKAIEQSSLAEALAPRLDELSIARARMPHAPDQDVSRGYARTLRSAQADACDVVARELAQSTDALEAAIDRRAFAFHYQPIVDVRSGSTLAYEALCRGTSDPLRFPDVIFGTAERTDRVWELGRVLRDIIAEGLDHNQPNLGPTEPLLFINVHPRDIDDPVFLEQALSGGLARNAHRVVIELTERAAIEDYRRVKAFFATLRRRGYRLAIDDLGSGYAGLTALAELEPDFIKFDMGLIRDLHLHPVKQRLIERMHEFACEIGAQTISEGVECAEERDALLRAGCSIMQGYYFARPAAEPPAVPFERFASPEMPEKGWQNRKAQ